MAEASGLIDPIVMWVLRKACATLAEWGPDMSVAINLAARQFMDPHLDRHVAEAIADAGIDGSQYYFSRPVPAEVIQGRFIELSQLKAA